MTQIIVAAVTGGFLVFTTWMNLRSNKKVINEVQPQNGLYEEMVKLRMELQTMRALMEAGQSLNAKQLAELETRLTTAEKKLELVQGRVALLETLN